MIQVRRSLRAVPLAGFVVGLTAALIVDQITKAGVELLIRVSSVSDLVDSGPAGLRLVHLHNGGGLLGAPADVSALGIAGLVMAMLMTALFVWDGPDEGVANVAGGLLVGGLLGNAIDRIRLGYVTDFLDVGTSDRSLLTLNAADVAIAAAILLLAWTLVRTGPERP